MNPYPFIEFTVQFPIDFTVQELLPQDQIAFQKSIRSTFLPFSNTNFIAQNGNKIVLYGKEATHIKKLVDIGFYNMLTYRILQHDPAVPVNIPFGIDGKVVTNFGTDNDQAFALAIQADGKIVAAGHTHTGNTQYDFGLARYNYDGSLDATFGIGGKVTTDFGTNFDEALGVTIQADGKIVAVGRTHTGNVQSDFAIARYNTDGSLDTTFGTGGKVITDFGTNFDEATAVTIQIDNKIVVAGFTHTGNTQYNFAIARYNTNGSLDATFGTGGKVITDFGTDDDEAYAIVIQKDNKMVVAGFTDTGGGFSSYDSALARYNTDGSLDTSFGVGGKVITDFGTIYDTTFALAIQKDNKIVACGYTFTGNTQFDFGLARYNTDGSLDTSFGVGGKVITDFGPDDFAFGVAIQKDNKIVASGLTHTGGTQYDFAVVRYHPNGTLDQTFASGGKVITDFGTNDDEGYQVIIQLDGKIVVVGFTHTGNTQYDFALARYLPNGTLDAY